jgi:hypothetical protein
VYQAAVPPVEVDGVTAAGSQTAEIRGALRVDAIAGAQVQG